MKKISKCFFLIVVITLTTQFRSSAQTPALPPYDSAYKIVFHDEFDSTFHTIIDTSKWSRTPGWGQSCNKVPYYQGCDSSTWDKAYIIRNDTDSTTIAVSNGTCKLITRKRNILEEVWNWPRCPNCGSTNDTSEVGDACFNGSLCSDTCRIYPNINDTGCHCFSKQDISFQYITGNLYSKPQFRYGYFEIRFKPPPSPTPPNNYDAVGPNFWLFGVDTTIGAYYSEIDIFELCSYDHHVADTSKRANVYTSNSHWQGLPNQNWTHNSDHVNTGINLVPDSFYTAACWWSHDFIKYYLNDSLLYQADYDSVPSDSLCAMMIFIDNNAPAFNFCSPFDSLFQFPYKYEIDYVRVYQRNDHCDSSVVYCNVPQSAFESGLYQSLKIGGDSCTDSFTGAYITGLGVDSVVLDEGFSIDTTSSAYFDVVKCNTSQSHQRGNALPSPNPPPQGILRKYNQSNY